VAELFSSPVRKSMWGLWSFPLVSFLSKMLGPKIFVHVLCSPKVSCYKINRFTLKKIF